MARQHTAKFGCHWYGGSGDIMLLVCQMISQDHLTKVLYDLIGKSSQGKSSPFQVMTSLTQWNTGLVSSRVHLTSWREDVSFALVDHPSSDCVTT